MTIAFVGGRLTNRANPADPAFLIPDAEAAAAGWRDFQEGLRPAERGFFDAPDADGRIAVTAAGTAGRAQAHEHVRLLIDGAEDQRRELFVMPIPVFQEMPANFQWVTQLAANRVASRGFRIELNRYGRFAVEWLDFITALGRTHHATRRARQDACVYATRFIGMAIAGDIAAGWRRRPGLVGRRRGDTVDRWVDREDTVTLFHELLVHVVRGRSGHAGEFDEWVETRARLNWLNDNPA
jgi:hypothetical protein